MRFSSSTLLIGAGLAHVAIANYAVQDDYSGNNFFSMFNFDTFNDPTSGYVNYLSKDDAQSANLASVENGVVTIRSDSSKVASGRGRDSVRITSKAQYTHGLVVLDLEHMPGNACGVWPGFWMTGPSWPDNGEIDIIEGVSMQSQNAMTLHTSASCSMNSQSCAGQPGCGTQNAGSLSYGDGFNNNKGGVYAMEWTSDNIKIWFWPRGSVPSDALGEAPNPSSWGEPMTHFAGGNGCTIDDHFNKNNIVFDTTFCGDWAGSVWGSTTECSAKAATCQDYVRDNPSAFTEAYWTINSLKVYSFNSAATSGRVDAQPDDSPVPYPVAVPSPTTSNAPLAETPTTSSILAVVPQPTTSPAPIIAAPASTPESDNMAVVIGLDGRIREMPVSESHTVRRNRTKARALGFEEVLQGGEVPVKRDGDVHGGITSRHLRRHQLGGLRGHSHS